MLRAHRRVVGRPLARVWRGAAAGQSCGAASRQQPASSAAREAAGCASSAAAGKLQGSWREAAGCASSAVPSAAPSCSAAPQDLGLAQAVAAPAPVAWQLEELLQMMRLAPRRPSAEAYSEPGSQLLTRAQCRPSGVSHSLPGPQCWGTTMPHDQLTGGRSVPSEMRFDERVSRSHGFAAAMHQAEPFRSLRNWKSAAISVHTTAIGTSWHMTGEAARAAAPQHARGFAVGGGGGAWAKGRRTKMAAIRNKDGAADTGPQLRVNRDITAPVVRLVYEDNTHKVLPILEALQEAIAAKQDLVEVSPRAEPPVCRFQNFGKAQYAAKLREKEQKKKLIDQQRKQASKDIRLSAFTGDRDVQLKLGQALEFLQKGHRVRIMVGFPDHRGFESANNMLRRAIDYVGDRAVVMQRPLNDRAPKNFLIAHLGPAIEIAEKLDPGAAA